MKSLLIILSLAAVISSQGPGNGISKSTWAASDPSTCLTFNLKYLAVENADDSCANN